MNERERFVRTLTCSNPDRPSYGDYFFMILHGSDGNVRVYQKALTSRQNDIATLF